MKKLRGSAATVAAIFVLSLALPQGGAFAIVHEKHKETRSQKLKKTQSKKAPAKQQAPAETQKRN